MMYFILSREVDAQIKDRFGMIAKDYVKEPDLLQVFKVFEKGDQQENMSDWQTYSRVPRYDWMRTYMHRLGLDAGINRNSKQKTIKKKNFKAEEVEFMNKNASTKKINHGNFLIHDIIGKGSFGEVYLVEKRDSKK